MPIIIIFAMLREEAATKTFSWGYAANFTQFCCCCNTLYHALADGIRTLNAGKFVYAYAQILFYDSSRYVSSMPGFAAAPRQIHATRTHYSWLVLLAAVASHIFDGRCFMMRRWLPHVQCRDYPQILIHAAARAAMLLLHTRRRCGAFQPRHQSRARLKVLSVCAIKGHYLEYLSCVKSSRKQHRYKVFLAAPHSFRS